MPLPSHDVNSVICSHNLSFFISYFSFYPTYILLIVNFVLLLRKANTTECEESIVRMALPFYKF